MFHLDPHQLAQRERERERERKENTECPSVFLIWPVLVRFCLVVDGKRILDELLVNSLTETLIHGGRSCEEESLLSSSSFSPTHSLTVLSLHIPDPPPEQPKVKQRMKVKAEGKNRLRLSTRN